MNLNVTIVNYNKLNLGVGANGPNFGGTNDLRSLGRGSEGEFGPKH